MAKRANEVNQWLQCIPGSGLKKQPPLSRLTSESERASSSSMAAFAEIAAAPALRRADIEVVVINRRNHDFFQPPLYQVATAARSFVRIFALPQLQVRLRVRRRWLWSYFAGQRSSRLIPEPARVAAP
ncbi:hypothetical protein [Rhizobium leguminosarum]